MVIALFSQEINKSVSNVIESFFSSKHAKQSKFFLENKIFNNFKSDNNLELISFSKSEDLDSSIDIMVSIGGDGTFLRSIEFIRDLDIPVMGINTGNLGFLATIKKENIEQSIEKIYTHKFKTENRSIIKVNHKEIGLPKSIFPYALNEISVSRKNTTSMIKIKTNLNGEFLNSYWADGLIISTPTGSTGYSLSCGGPIMSPLSETLSLTPIAPHNLNARPIIIPDNTKIELFVTGREKNHLLSLDSKIISLKNGTLIKIKKAEFKIRIAHLYEDNFYKTLRSKLLWGEDKRN